MLGSFVNIKKKLNLINISKLKKVLSSNIHFNYVKNDI